MINAAFVRECKPRAKMYEVTCDALPGFILRVLPTGKKVALVRYRVAGKDHRERIGLLGPTLTLDEARRRAAIMLANVAAGEGDGATTSATTAGTRAPVKQVEPARSQIETLRSLAERFIRVHVDARLKSGTAERYRQNIRDVILPYKEIEDKPKKNDETEGKPTEGKPTADKPTFGERDFRSIKRSEINALHASLSKTPAAANSVLGTISSLFTWIYEDRELPDLRNPAFGIERFPLKKRERFLTPEERQRVQAVIDAGLKIPAGRKGHLHIAMVWAFDLLGLTGRRRNEIVLLKWEMVNWQHAFLDLPDTKGGQLKIQVSKHVLGLLKYIHDQTGNPRTGYVLRGPKGTRIKSINRSWEKVRAAAGIPDVRLHDLRHSFASDALMCGVPLAVVGAMLGHKHDRTTQRYAHLANDVVREGLEAATDRIIGATRAVAMLTPPPFERLTDRQWKRIAAIVEATRGTCGGTRTDLRRAVDAIRWVLHNGAKWRAMPKNLGRPTTCWRWYERWCGDGTWARITAALELPEIEVGREPRGASRAKPTIDVVAVEVRPASARRGRPAALRQSA
ncbi:MAG: tyrosine-type recombinase/integrase [Myxococcales bacterium]|nr:tyrosine-type recombinase/integrase [Myxococcales bacterium]